MLDARRARIATRSSAIPGDREALRYGAPAVPHAQGQRPDGRPDRARRVRVRRREDPQPAARRGSRRYAGDARAARMSPRRASGSGSGRSRTPATSTPIPPRCYAAIGRVAAELPAECDAERGGAPPPSAQIAAPQPIVAGPPKLRSEGTRFPEAAARRALDARRTSVPERRTARVADRRSALRPRPRRMAATRRRASPTARRGGRIRRRSRPRWSRKRSTTPTADAEIIEFAPVGEMPAGSRCRRRRCRRRPMSSTSATWRFPRTLFAVLVDEAQVISRRSSTSSRCCSSIRGKCRPRRWCARVTRCAASIAPAAFR